MHLLHSPNDPMLEETLRYLAQNAIESPQSNFRVQVGKITLACTSNVLASQSVTFNKPFRSAPFILLSKNPATTSSAVTESYGSLTAQGVTLQAYTATAQNVDITYLAIGSV